MNLRVGLLASLAVSLTLSSVFTTSSALCADAVDKSLVGIWEARFTAQGGICSKTWTIKPDGDSVIMDVPEHGGDAFGVAGKIAFSDGRCIFTSPEGRKDYRRSEEQYRKAIFVDPLNADAYDGLQQSLEKLDSAGSR
jgi:hypothetical protein